jgi:YHS domain-containing protein
MREGFSSLTELAQLIVEEAPSSIYTHGSNYNRTKKGGQYYFSTHSHFSLQSVTFRKYREKKPLLE